MSNKFDVVVLVATQVGVAMMEMKIVARSEYWKHSFLSSTVVHQRIIVAVGVFVKKDEKHVCMSL